MSSVCTRQTVGDCEELHPSSDTHAAGILIRKLFAVVQHDIEHEGSNLKTTFFFSCVCRCWIDPVHLQRHTVVIPKVFSALDFYCSFNYSGSFELFITHQQNSLMSNNSSVLISKTFKLQSNWITTSTETAHVLNVHYVLWFILSQVKHERFHTRAFTHMQYFSKV